MVSSLGGIQSLVMLAMTIMYAPINRLKRSKYLVKKVYSLLVSDARETDIESDKNDNKKLGLYISNSQQDPKHDKVDEKIRKGWFRCMKKKEPSSVKVVVQERKMQAMKRIEESLDVLKLVRDLNYLKVITHMLLRDRHLGLAQLVGFELWKSEYELESQMERLDSQTT